MIIAVVVDDRGMTRAVSLFHGEPVQAYINNLLERKASTPRTTVEYVATVAELIR
jgi:hypothetical protein